MKYVLYLIIFVLLITDRILMTSNQELLIGTNFYSNDVILILVVIIMLLLKERFFHQFLFSILFYILVSLMIYFNEHLYLLFGLILVDIWFKKNLILAIIFSVLPLYLIFSQQRVDWFILFIFSSFSGYLLYLKSSEHHYFIGILDNERRLRYELESTKTQLLHHSREVERLTEIKERTRIARSIHDHIGHDIAGVLFQLQASEKISSKDPTKASQIVSLCINKLSNSLEMIRNTVHNIKPENEISEKLFKDIISRFIFCPINFKINGNIQELSPEIIEILLVNMKESLTNALKYSNASNIDITIDITKSYTRYYYKDNGKGCIHIKEGLGLSGMKERIKNVNGRMTLDGSGGFSIVCMIPHQKTNIFNE